MNNTPTTNTPITTEEIPVMLSLKETAIRFNLPVHFVRTLVANRSIYAVSNGRKFFVNQQSVADYLNGKPWAAGEGR